MTSSFPFRNFSSTTAEEEPEKRLNINKMDYYQILEVSPNANPKALKKAYFRIAKKYHPDVYSGINTDYFKKANEAFTVLKNPLKRKEYNK